MVTITEDYCDFETAKLLKEKGFSENTICKYADVGGVTEKWYDDYRERVLRFNWEEGHLIEPLIEPKDQYEIIGDTIFAPTLQMAMKWLREVHNLHIITIPYAPMDRSPYHPGEADIVYIAQLFRGIIPIDEVGRSIIKLTHEQACEAAIKYCLENLI